MQSQIEEIKIQLQNNRNENNAKKEEFEKIFNQNKIDISE